MRFFAIGDKVSEFAENIASNGLKWAFPANRNLHGLLLPAVFLRWCALPLCLLPRWRKRLIPTNWELPGQMARPAQRCRQLLRRVFALFALPRIHLLLLRM